MSAGKIDYLSRLETVSVFFFKILNGTTKAKLAIVPFLYCGGIVENYRYSSLELSSDTQMKYLFVFEFFASCSVLYCYCPKMKFAKGYVFTGVCLSMGSLSRGSLSGGLWSGGSLSRGVCLGGSLSRGTPTPRERPPAYNKEQAVRILLECILVSSDFISFCIELGLSLFDLINIERILTEYI